MSDPETADADAAAPARFARTRVTWLAYIALAAYSFCLYALGPVLAFLHTELHLSYTVTSLHSTLWAAGTVAAGLGFHRVTRRLGRRRVIWWAAGSSGAGALLFVFGHRLGITLAAAAVLGTGGSFLQTSTTAILADTHPGWRDRALVEANVGASATAVLVPVVLGFLAATAAGWRVGMLIPVVTLAGLFVVFRRTALPAQPGLGHVSSRRPQRDLMVPCLLVALVVAIEFCIVFSGIQLLGSGVGLATADGARLMSLFFIGELAGRLGGAAVIRRPGRARRVLDAALALTLVGFILLWSTHFVVLAGVGLFVAGLGIANLYPLTIAMALAAGHGQTDLAAARTLLAVGISVAVAPLALGILADHVGIRGAFAIELVLIGAAALLVALSRSRDGGDVTAVS